MSRPSAGPPLVAASLHSAVLGALIALAPGSIAAQVHATQAIVAADSGHVVRVTTGATSQRQTSRSFARAAAPLTVAQKQSLVGSSTRRTPPQPEPPIHIDAKTPLIPNRAELIVKNASFYAGQGWGIFLPTTASRLELNVRLDAGKMDLLDCLVLSDPGGGTVSFQAGNQTATTTVGAFDTHVTWVFTPQTSDWYRISLSATGKPGNTVDLEVSYCEITPFK
jgi:hypothetical protein